MNVGKLEQPSYVLLAIGIEPNDRMYFKNMYCLIVVIF